MLSCFGRMLLMQCIDHQGRLRFLSALLVLRVYAHKDHGLTLIMSWLCMHSPFPILFVLNPDFIVQHPAQTHTQSESVISTERISLGGRTFFSHFDLSMDRPSPWIVPDISGAPWIFRCLVALSLVYTKASTLFVAFTFDRAAIVRSFVVLQTANECLCRSLVFHNMGRRATCRI